MYLDDIIVDDNLPEEHSQHLTRVFEHLQEHELVLSRAKCEFAKPDLRYPALRHTNQRRYNDSTSQSLTSDRKPRPAENVQRASELSGADKVGPLTDLLLAKNTYAWIRETTTAFNNLRVAFERLIHLHRPDTNRPFVLQPVASEVSIAAGLYQPGDVDGKR